MSRRSVVAWSLAAVCALIAGGMLVAGLGGGSEPAGVSEQAGAKLAAAQSGQRTAVIYRGVGRNGQVDVAQLDPEPGAPSASALKCDRVYFAAGRGICLAPGGGVAATRRAQLFDARLRVRRSIELQGVPSRTRVSPDGRYGAATMFVSGHAYTAAGSFSTQTTLIDLATGRKLTDLEQFTVFKGSRQVVADDVNFWGVTFARDSDVFYATLATGGKAYLIRGSVSGRTAQVLQENVECPSLSPDETRVVHKRRTGTKDNPWRLTVLDLKTMRETPLAETRSVDDQAEWLDDDHVLYGLDGDIWVAAADGTGIPRRLIRGGESPAVVRGS